ncbi:MAG TPA: hypothetical protein PLG10_01545 [Candidatus Dojkabacteria bacterium]|jgi:hypothetical protein|nr:hypothetical protein [Candidatus Dojkabacteria bacterium]
MKKGIRVFLSVLVIFLLLGGYFVVRYSLWHRDFFVSENITCTSDEKFVVEEKEINIGDRIKNFVLSDLFSEFVTFSRKEMLYLLKDSISGVSSLEIQDVCLVSDKGVWKVYAHSKVTFLQLPWIGVDIVKDNRETAELYSRNIYIGDIKVPDVLTRKPLEKINKGISDALILVTENGFLGKTIENIDLLKDTVVIKGGF